MKKLSLSAIALIGLTAAAAPAFAADVTHTGAAHHARGAHHHHGKKCGMKHAAPKKEDGKAPQATDDLNASSLQKSAQPAAPQAPAPQAPSQQPVPDAAPAN